jgi:hypothetical protein
MKFLSLIQRRLQFDGLQAIVLPSGCCRRNGGRWRYGVIHSAKWRVPPF